ncbi:MAG: hypothetical protein ACK5Z5_08265 [Neisseriaceae bacterium]
MKVVLFSVFCGFVTKSFAIGLADFVPNFLTPKPQAKKNIIQKTNESAKINRIIDPRSNPVTTKVQQPKKATNYCYNTDGTVSNSVFCKNYKVESDVHLADISRRPILANLPETTNPDLAPKQTAMQSQEFRTALNRYNSSFMLSVHPQQNLGIGMGVTEQGFNQFQFNLKY